jgi:hypothetical protein
MSFINSIFHILQFNKKNWKAVVLCVFTATIFWCFNALNKRYTTTISFPLTFEYDRERFIPVMPLPQSVRINVTGIGWNLFRRGSGVKVPPLVIPLEKPAEVKKIVGSTLPGLFANQLGGFEINFIITDTLHLAVEPKGKRLLKLAPDIAEMIFRKGYTLVSPVTVSPDTVRVVGPVRLLASLTDPFYIKVPQRNIDEDYSETVELKFLNDELIERNPQLVNISFKVDRLVDVQDSIHLALEHAPKSAAQFFGRKKLKCRFAIPESLMDDYNRDSVTAVVDLKNFKRGTIKILPRFDGLPAYSRVTKVDSVVVRF